MRSFQNSANVSSSYRTFQIVGIHQHLAKVRSPPSHHNRTKDGLTGSFHRVRVKRPIFRKLCFDGG